MKCRYFLFVPFLATFLNGCSTHFSTLQAGGTSTKIICAIKEEQAFQIAYSAIATTLPGRKISEVDGPIRGYSTYFRFVLDTYTQQVLVYPASGIDAEGKRVKGYYFEVSGSGSSVVQGKAKNEKLFERVSESARATGKSVAVTDLQAATYDGAKWRLNQSEEQKASGNAAATNSKEDALNSLERLKHLRDQGVISDQEFEKKKKELLDRI